VPIFKGLTSRALHFSEQDRLGRYQPRPRCRARSLYPKGFTSRLFHGQDIVTCPRPKRTCNDTTGAIRTRSRFAEQVSPLHAHLDHETLVESARDPERNSMLVCRRDGWHDPPQRPGPRLMSRSVKNVILASADQVAIDAVAARSWVLIR